MRFAAVVSCCLILAGCGSYAPPSNITPAPSFGRAAAGPPSGLASTLYTIADDITGYAAAGATGNIVPTAALLSVSGTGITAH